MTASRYLYPTGAVLVEVLEWATAQMRRVDTSFVGFRPEAVAIAHASNGQLRAVVVFDLFSDADCMMHVVSDGRAGWLTREFLIRAFAYVFIQRRQRRVTCMVSERNRPSLLFTRRFGWTEEGRLRQAGPSGEDMLIFGMLAGELPPMLHRPFLPNRVAEAARNG